MDPITAAIIAFAPFVGEKLGENLLSDAYGALKTRIKTLLGEKNAVVDAVQKVEQNPTEGRKLCLHEEIVACGLDRDAEAQRLATALTELVKRSGGTNVQNNIHVNTAIGSTIIGSQHHHRQD